MKINISQSSIIFLFIAVTVVGCSDNSGPHNNNSNGIARERVTAKIAGDGSWAADLSFLEKKLYITTYGSSSCPAVVDTVELSAPDHLTVKTVRNNSRENCTADMTPYTSEIVPPEEIFNQSSVRVSLEGNSAVISLPNNVGGSNETKN